MCNVTYGTFIYDDSATTLDIADDHSVSITLRGNRYKNWQDTVGVYKFHISANEHAEICSMLDDRKFRKGPSPKYTYPGEEYEYIIFKQAGQDIRKTLTRDVKLTPYMSDVYNFFTTMLDDNIKSRQAYLGFSCSIENLKTDVNGRIQFTVAIINKGKIPFSIPAFGAGGCIIDVGITSSDVYFGIDDKYITRLSLAAKDNQILLLPTEQYEIDYSIDKSELPVGYRGISIELLLSLTFENKIAPQRFSLMTLKDI